MRLTVSDVNAALPEGAPHVRIGDDVATSTLRILVYVAQQASRIAAMADRLEALNASR